MRLHYCKFCGTRGCLACDHLRGSERIQAQLIVEARKFVEGTLSPPDRDLVLADENWMSLLGLAISHGKKLMTERAVLGGGEESEGVRFDWVEFHDGS